jgi:leader peptidase (prepilin peptidase)/N-methyltransferase
MPLDTLTGPLGIGLAAVLGLLIGSFLNVVIHRLPIMLERRWAAECAELHPAAPAVPSSTPQAPQAPALNLLTPRSRCPACGTGIAWYHNLPLLSYALLRGKCSACAAPIGLRYPLVELLTGLGFAYVMHLHGPGWPALAWMGFVAAVLALAFIDWDTTLLPDDITLPLLWAGLLAAALGWSGLALDDALWGAVAGYLSLWSIYWAFKLLTGKEGMGYGDFKLFAALGAWLGWQALIPILLLASVLGAVVGLAMKYSSGLREGGYVPFGPFLAFGALLALVLGPATLLGWVGL